MQHITFNGRLLIIGFGSIGQGVLPLIMRHIAIAPAQITILAADRRGAEIADSYGVSFEIAPVTRENMLLLLEARLGAGDFLLNLSVDVSSIALVAFCQARDAYYLDTCTEPWAGGYTDTTRTPAERSNYALRESMLALAGQSGPTAVVTHGANPGLVSHFVKQALLNLAADTGRATTTPTTRADWGGLAEALGVKVIHIAERDTQTTLARKQPGEFVNTWSIDGFVGEGCQPAELGWGSHENSLPTDGRTHDSGCGSAIYLLRPGAGTQVRTWTPLAGPILGYLVTHTESIAIADYFTVRDGDQLRYRPTVHYAYHPCDDAVLSLHELAGLNWQTQTRKRLIVEEITSGTDELGVLLMGHARGAYWYGSRLSIEQARAAAPYNNATSLQVAAAVMAGMVWALENPRAGVVEPDAMDHARVLEIASPYLGDIVGVYSDWTPLQDRGVLFPEEIDVACSWQFGNFRVS